MSTCQYCGYDTLSYDHDALCQACNEPNEPPESESAKKRLARLEAENKQAKRLLSRLALGIYGRDLLLAIRQEAKDWLAAHPEPAGEEHANG